MLQTTGAKSTEFLLALATLILGAALLGVGSYQAKPELIDAGKWLATIATGGYSLSRGIAKFFGGKADGSADAAPVVPTDDKTAAATIANIK